MYIVTKHCYTRTTIGNINVKVGFNMYANNFLLMNVSAKNTILKVKAFVILFCIKVCISIKTFQAAFRSKLNKSLRFHKHISTLFNIIFYFKFVTYSFQNIIAVDKINHHFLLSSVINEQSRYFNYALPGIVI